MSVKTKYTLEGVSGGTAGVCVYFKRETGGVPRFENITVPWHIMLNSDLVREIVMRHSRSMEAPPPWNTGDEHQPLFT